MPKTSQRKLATDAEKEVWQRIGGYALQDITENRSHTSISVDLLTVLM
jgi:hypothetical protein